MTNVADQVGTPADSVGRGASRHEPSDEVVGEIVARDGEEYYRIVNVDRMRPFFMTIVSASDHWLFISSNGGLTAGRRNPESALFPYYTDDKIHDSAETTGSKTIIIAGSGDRRSLWEPFSIRSEGIFRTRRHLLKSTTGDKILFEEANLDLGLTFGYEWCTSDAFGFVKRSFVRNTGDAAVALKIIDGIQNILPAGVDPMLQLRRSTLVDAYKKNELDRETGLGIYALSSIPVDRAEPSEALSATTVWSKGLVNPTRLVSAAQLDRFRNGREIDEEIDVRAERGAYFVHAELKLDPAVCEEWYTVAEVGQGTADVQSLADFLQRTDDPIRHVRQDVRKSTAELRRIVASADGLQRTGDRLGDVRHYSNVLFNVMRGGVFARNYEIERSDLKAFVRSHNVGVADRNNDFFGRLDEVVRVETLLSQASEVGDPQLERLCYEYLPLTFSRRHGDPSRPWNAFSIETRGRDGSRMLHYEGNWRDIFQNWEALSLSYPSFVESFVCKFVNATTVDGYNPYRVTRDGIDWETVDPADPWSYIGYWGDHQIVYLLKLLQISGNHHPGVLERLLSEKIFSYANVPYRIKPYADLLRDPHNTIDFDVQAELVVEERVASVGADGRLVWNRSDEVHLVTLCEKLLVLVLAKLANFVAGGGIWMNTQRPEWNDANNALVGNGVSMVTLCYLRRFLIFLDELVANADVSSFEVAEEVEVFFADVVRAFEDCRSMLSVPPDDGGRKRLLDLLGGAGSRYRESVYDGGFSERAADVSKDRMRALITIALAYLDQTLELARRADGLYDAYNLISIEGDSIMVRRLYEMLEGQVAVLSSGALSAQESVEVLDALRSSALFRADQHSYMLYPDRRLPRFMEKNLIPAGRAKESRLISKLVNHGDRRLVTRSGGETLHFSPGIRNAAAVRSVLEELRSDGYEEDVASDAELVLQTYEEMFDHAAFTGRSGTFFGYEGLGCIYWHMVSKLLLAVADTYFGAADSGADPETLRRLAEHYYDIRAGIGVHKSPSVYGAFPTDPYSHTPGNAGAQQPGMTGQVKEDIVARWAELGVTVGRGKIRFRPILLRGEEMLERPGRLALNTDVGRELEPGSIGFTYCQVPIVYRASGAHGIEVVYADGMTRHYEGLELDGPTSTEIFRRDGTIERIVVGVVPGL